MKYFVYNSADEVEVGEFETEAGAIDAILEAIAEDYTNASDEDSFEVYGFTKKFKYVPPKDKGSLVAVEESK